MHDGSAATLAEAIRAHAWTDFSDSQLDSLSQYLNQIDQSEPDAAFNEVNQNPEISGDWPTRQNLLDETIFVRFLATDPDADENLVFGAVDLPEGLRMNPETGEVLGQATAEGHYETKVFVTDGRGGAAVVQFDWLIGETTVVPTGETHLCVATSDCDIDLGWLKLSAASGTFGQDVLLQVRFAETEINGRSQQEPDDLINGFMILAFDATTGESVEPLAEQFLQIEYRLSKEYFESVDSYRLDLVRAGSSAGWQTIQGEREAGSVTFQLPKMGQVGLISGRNLIYLPLVR